MMEIQYEGGTYHFDMEETTTEQLVKILKTYGLNLLDLSKGMQQGNIEALQCIWWLIQVQGGKDLLRLETVKIDKPVKFASAIMLGLIREQQELVAKAEIALAEHEKSGKPDPKE